MDREKPFHLVYGKHFVGMYHPAQEQARVAFSSNVPSGTRVYHFALLDFPVIARQGIPIIHTQWHYEWVLQYM